MVSGVVLLDESGVEQQAALRVLHEDDPFGHISGEGDGRYRQADGLELHIDHLRRI